MEEPIESFYNSDNVRFSLLMRLSAELALRHSTATLHSIQNVHLRRYGRRDQHDEPWRIWTFALIGLYARIKFC